MFFSRKRHSAFNKPKSKGLILGSKCQLKVRSYNAKKSENFSIKEDLRLDQTFMKNIEITKIKSTLKCLSFIAFKEFVVDAESYHINSFLAIISINTLSNAKINHIDSAQVL